MWPLLSEGSVAYDTAYTIKVSCQLDLRSSKVTETISLLCWNNKNNDEKKE